METPERSVEGLKEISTHYWIRQSEDDYIGSWSIVDMNQSNIHIINDPKHYGFEVIAIPNTPAERQKREEVVEEAYRAGKQSFLKDIRKINHKEIGNKTSYIIFDEVGEVDWGKLQAFTHPNNPK